MQSPTCSAYKSWNPSRITELYDLITKITFFLKITLRIQNWHVAENNLLWRNPHEISKEETTRVGGQRERERERERLSEWRNERRKEKVTLAIWPGDKTADKLDGQHIKNVYYLSVNWSEMK